VLRVASPRSVQARLPTPPSPPRFAAAAGVCETVGKAARGPAGDARSHESAGRSCRRDVVGRRATPSVAIMDGQLLFNFSRPLELLTPELLSVFRGHPPNAKIYRARHSAFGPAGRLPAAYFFPGNLRSLAACQVREFRRPDRNRFRVDEALPGRTGSRCR
jgi:hypothetical protein